MKLGSGVKWRIRGGVTAVTGYILVALGMISVVVACREGSQFLAEISSTWVPGPAIGPTYAAALDAFGTLIAGGGVLLVGFARGERDREEALRLDPLLYAPHRHPTRRVVPVLLVVLICLILPALFLIPVSNSFSLELAVGTCNPSSGIPVQNVSLPSGAMLAFEWRSSDGHPVGEVWAPSGPPVGEALQIGALFYNSSYGYSFVKSTGDPIQFFACDFSSVSGAPRTVLVTGTFYTTVL